jgi:hypothetical protein
MVLTYLHNGCVTSTNDGILNMYSIVTRLFVKKSPKTHFCQNYMIHNLYHGKSRPKISATTVVFVKLPKPINRPMGKNSSNMVTVMYVQTQLPS